MQVESCLFSGEREDRLIWIGCGGAGGEIVGEMSAEWRGSSLV